MESLWQPDLTDFRGIKLMGANDFARSVYLLDGLDRNQQSQNEDPRRCLFSRSVRTVLGSVMGCEKEVVHHRKTGMSFLGPSIYWPPSLIGNPITIQTWP